MKCTGEMIAAQRAIESRGQLSKIAPFVQLLLQRLRSSRISNT